MTAGADLVALLGVKAERTTYVLDGRTEEAYLATVAVARLRPDVERVIAFCTPKAEEETFPVLRNELPGLEVLCRRVSVGADAASVAGFVKAVADEVRGRQRVVLDLTHGWRHLALLAFVAATCEVALGEAEVVAAYYGLLGSQGRSHLVDLRPLLELWTLATAADAFRRGGSLLPLAERLRASGGKDAEMIARDLEALTAAYASGLPLELGREAGRFVKDTARRLRGWGGREGVPLIDRVADVVHETLEPLALQTCGQGWKQAVPLDERELQRQACLVDRLLEQGAHGPALVLMEEWAVSWACLRLGVSGWLDREARLDAEARLHALRAWEEDPALREDLTEDQRRLAQWWRDLGECRNSFAHAGMRREVVDPWRSKGKLASLLSEVEEGWRWVRELPEVPLELPGEFDSLLVAPVGTAPGAFEAALEAVGPHTRCLAICSLQTEGAAREAMEAAGRPTDSFTPLILQDPFGGVAEVPDLVRKARPTLARAHRVVVCLTGGTSLMGFVALRLAQEARALGRAVRRFVLVEEGGRGRPVWLEGEG